MNCSPASKDEAAVLAENPPLSAAHPLAIKIARKACRAFSGMRADHDEAIAERSELPTADEPACAGIDSALDQWAYSAESLCLWALDALKPRDDSRRVSPCMGSHAVRVDGRLFVLSRDDDSRDSRTDGRRLTVIDAADVLDLTPEGLDESAPAAVPPSVHFTVDRAVWRVSYLADFHAAAASGLDFRGTSYFPDESGGAFGFTLTEHRAAPQVGGIRMPGE